MVTLFSFFLLELKGRGHGNGRKLATRRHSRVPQSACPQTNLHPSLGKGAFPPLITLQNSCPPLTEICASCNCLGHEPGQFLLPGWCPLVHSVRFVRSSPSPDARTAFLIAGWLPSILMLLVFALVSYYTATILYAILTQHGLTSYTAIGRRAFGPQGVVAFRLVFLLDLFFTAASYLVLVSDSITTLYPRWTSAFVKMAIMTAVAPITLIKDICMMPVHANLENQPSFRMDR